MFKYYFLCRKLTDYDQLHREILEFCDDISPRRSEEAMRNEVVQRVRTLVQRRWYGNEVNLDQQI